MTVSERRAGEPATAWLYAGLRPTPARMPKPLSRAPVPAAFAGLVPACSDSRSAGEVAKAPLGSGSVRTPLNERRTQ